MSNKHAIKVTWKFEPNRLSGHIESDAYEQLCPQNKVSTRRSANSRDEKSSIKEAKL